ncbi:unnamed protein product [Arctia plantaginis]|uniref:Major facilitator superfamily (MFS) profile domain-containing protein n=1 Tax=Arctia plantaginis TaxID=874455 RepID=A0A8S1B7K0_ARCPL|nr:unnamed protein product [Arctia plantaginis]
MEEYPCLIFDTDLLLLDPNLDKTLIPLVPCKEFIYDTSMFPRTIVSEWNLVCDRRWLVHACQVVMMWGILVGGIFFGVVADKYGRRTPLLIAIVIEGVGGLLASVIPWFWVFLINWFILAMANGGISLIAFVLCMEVVSGKWRTIIPVLHQLPFGLGNALMAGLANWLRDWRKLELALGCFTSSFILFWIWIPESPRWLIASGQMDKALEILVQAAKMNSREISVKEISRLLSKHVNPMANKSVPTFSAFLKSKNMRMKTILLSMNWFCTGLSFYTFAQYLGSIGRDIFIAVAVTGIISSLGGLTCVYVVTKVGRKTALGLYQGITGICFILLLLQPESKLKANWARLLFAGIGFGGMAGTVPVLYLYSGEIFPTLGRNCGLVGVSTFARVGSMIAPVMLLLEGFLAGFPLLILTIISICQMLMILPLPETKNVNLPDTLEEAEKI